MKLLLDTHTLIWAVDDPSQLSARAAAELRNLGNDPLLGAERCGRCRSTSTTAVAVVRRP